MIRILLAAGALAVSASGVVLAQRAVAAANVAPANVAPAAARVETAALTADADTAGGRTRPRRPESEGAAVTAVTLERESYSYASDGRRDPFTSLMRVDGELRPMPSDLKLAVVAYDADGGSVAVLRNVGTDEQYRVRVGQQLGRMRVVAIHPKQIVFTIEEFGFSRQETLTLGDSTTPRTQQ